MRIGVRGKLLIFAALVWAVIFGAYSLYIYNERIEQTRRMALNTASFLSREIIADMQFYTSTVVKRALEAGLEVTDNYHDVPSSIPLPITFIKEVSRAIDVKGGYQMALISRDPINPSSAPSDEFQNKALDSFHNGDGAMYYSFERVAGKESVRYMVPDIATSETCVGCHNNRPGGVTRNYAIGDVLGALEVVVPIESEMKVAMADIWRSIAYGFIVVLTMGIAGLAFIRRVVTNPLEALVETTDHLARGDLTGDSAVASDDEIGDLSSKTNEVIRNLNSMIEEMRRASTEAADITARVSEMSSGVLEGSNAQGARLDSIGASVEEMNTAMADIVDSTARLAESLEKGSASVGELGASIGDVVDSLEALFTSVEETAGSTRAMSFSVKETSENIESLSGAIMQVSSSMAQIDARTREIEANAGEAAKFAEEVIRDARAGMESVESTRQGIVRIDGITRESSVIISNLRERIREIGKILDVIRDVSEETNLLALNAAIIAARSGEEGKSFAVVANEIRDLAERTSTSAKEVSEIIQAVEVESDRAGKAMERGFESVEEVVTLSQEAAEELKQIVDSAGRSATSSRDIARAAAEQASESRSVAESTERVAEMTARIVNATREQAKGSELINKASERMAVIAEKVKGSGQSQVESIKTITRTVEDVNTLVAHINSVVREQGRNTSRVLEAIAAVRRVSMENIEKAVDTEKAVLELTELNRALTESVRKFKLKRPLP